MAVREYIGARYVPIFGRKGEESIEWDNSNSYEPLTIVLHQGNSYTSRQYVPASVDIANENYWALTGNYNAQIESYRAEVRAYDSRIVANENAIAAEQAMRESADSALQNQIGNGFSSELPISSAMANLDSEFSNLENELKDDISGIQADIAIINSDNWVTAPRIAPNVVTTDKIVNSAITIDKIADSVFTQRLNYHTPEMYGAVGDGVANDWQAFANMFAAMADGDIAVLQHSEYRIEDTLILDKNFCRLISFERSETKPVMKFYLDNYNDVKCLTVTGAGNTFSGIHLAQDGNANGSYIIYFDGAANDYNIDATIDGCVLSNGWNGIGIVGRNVHVTNCLISTISATSIVILKPITNTPLRGYVFDNNRFHAAGMLVNTNAITDYSDIFNLALVNNFVDFSKRLYLGITDNVNISGNTVFQSTLTGDNLILASNTVKLGTSMHVCNNMYNGLASTLSGNPSYIGGIISISANCKGVISITGNTFETYRDSTVILVAANTNNMVILINGNNIHTEGVTTAPIQIVNSPSVVGLITGNCITTKSTANYISAAGFTVENNYTNHLSFV